MMASHSFGQHDGGVDNATIDPLHLHASEFTNIDVDTTIAYETIQESEIVLGNSENVGSGLVKVDFDPTLPQMTGQTLFSLSRWAPCKTKPLHEPASCSDITIPSENVAATEAYLSMYHPGSDLLGANGDCLYAHTEVHPGN